MINDKLGYGQSWRRENDEKWEAAEIKFVNAEDRWLQDNEVNLWEEVNINVWVLKKDPDYT